MQTDDIRGYAGAIVILGDTTMPSVGRVRTYLMETSDDTSRPIHVSLRGGSLVVEYEEGMGVAEMVTEPIPWSDLEPVCEQSWHWPEAADALRRHAAQLVVSIGTKHDDPVQRALLLTRFVAAITTLSSARGVFWVDGGIVHSPTYFVGKCREISRESVPLELWVGFSGMEDPEGTVSMSTMGLRKLGHPEIEVRHSSESAEDVFDIVFAAAHFVVDTGTELKDGDAFEVSDEQEVPIRHVPSSLDPADTAVLLEL